MFKLQILNLRGTSLTSKGAEYLLNALSSVLSNIHLDDLDISNNEILFGTEHLPSLCNLLSNPVSHLRTLSISHNQLGDELFSRLAQVLSVSTA